jgi:hypothetical protein
VAVPRLGARPCQARHLSGAPTASPLPKRRRVFLDWPRTLGSGRSPPPTNARRARGEELQANGPRCGASPVSIRQVSAASVSTTLDGALAQRIVVPVRERCLVAPVAKRGLRIDSTCDRGVMNLRTGGCWQCNDGRPTRRPDAQPSDRSRLSPEQVSRLGRGTARASARAPRRSTTYRDRRGPDASARPGSEDDRHRVHDDRDVVRGGHWPRR